MKTHRIISALLTVCCISLVHSQQKTPVPVVTNPAPVVTNPVPISGTPITVTPSDLQIVWEAEWVNRMTGTYDILQTTGASGDGALWTKEGTGRQNGYTIGAPKNPDIIMGLADYYINVPSSGRYQVFMRIWALDACSNSCWVGIDDFSVSKMTYFPGGKTGRLGARNYRNWPESYYKRWVWVTDETANHYLRKGNHHMRVQVREDGFAIDQIALLPIGSPTPHGKLPTTHIPGSKGLPSTVSLSQTIPSTVKSVLPTPYDVFLSLDDPVLTGSPLTTTGYAMVRLNTTKTVTVDLTLTCESCTIKPGSAISCTLSPKAPIAMVPLKFELPRPSERRSYAVTASATSTSCPGLTVVRSQQVTHTFDWYVSSPCNLSTAQRIFRTLSTTNPTTLATLPEKDGWTHLDWKQALPRKHFNDCGAVDIGKLRGQMDNKAIVAATWVTAKKDERLGVYGAGDDTLMLYRGPRMVMYDNRKKPLTDTIKQRSVHIPAGKHLLIAIVTQRKRWWQFYLDFRNPDGSPSANITGHTWK